jgi:hypothetical protein
MEAMQKAQPVGYIRLANSRGYELKYARSNALPDGTRQVVIALDRPLSFGEVLGSTVDTQQYNFAFVELRFPTKGKGEGKLAPATMISIDRTTGQIEIENYTTQPVRLSSITSKVEEIALRMGGAPFADRLPPAPVPRPLPVRKPLQPRCTGPCCPLSPRIVDSEIDPASFATKDSGAAARRQVVGLSSALPGRPLPRTRRTRICREIRDSEAEAVLAWARTSHDPGIARCRIPGDRSRTEE